MIHIRITRHMLMVQPDPSYMNTEPVNVHVDPDYQYLINAILAHLGNTGAVG